MNRTKLITPLMLVALLLTSCQVAPAPPPAAPATVTEEAIPTAEATEEAAPSGEVTATEAMTPIEEITPTEEMTAAVSVPFEAIQIILEYDPGSWSPPHTHGGPTLATVLEGEVTVRKKATGAETVYGAGEFFTEGVGEVFGAGNAGQEKARLAALFLLPEGANLTTVQEGTATEDMPPGPTIVYRTSMPVSESLSNFEAIQIILEYAPGSWSPPHTHGGPTLATVLEGEITVREVATGAETVYGAGEFFTEDVGEVFSAGNAGQEKARLAALFLLPQGASLTTVQEGTATEDMPPGPTIIYRTSMPATTAAE